ncbi:MAG TPA: PH domain-containing protein [Candidatus Limnocylindrales bacterium]|nr:PH domain-containing protein [Candidatus Limnocylindrales bacterium]
MAPNTLRWSAFLIGMLAFAMRVVTTFWVAPLTWDMSEGVGPLALIAALMASAIIPLGIFSLIHRWDRNRSAGFTVVNGRLTVGPSLYQAGTQAILMLFFGAGVVPTERDRHLLRLSESRSDWLVVLSFTGVMVALALACLLVRRPRIDLDPEGLTIRQLFQSTRLGWDQIAPGSPMVEPAKRWWGRMRIDLKATHSYPLSLSIPIARLNMDPASLVSAIRHYVEHPEDRATIGTGDAPVLYAPC